MKYNAEAMHTISFEIKNEQDAKAAIGDLMNYLVHGSVERLISDQQLGEMFWAGVDSKTAKSFCDVLGVKCENGCDDCPRRVVAATTKLLIGMAGKQHAKVILPEHPTRQ